MIPITSISSNNAFEILLNIKKFTPITSHQRICHFIFVSQLFVFGRVSKSFMFIAFLHIIGGKLPPQHLFKYVIIRAQV